MSTEAEFWKVKVGSIWLTDDGLETGRPCQVEVAGVGPLFLDYIQNIRKAADGTPYAFILPSNWQGTDLLITVATMEIGVFDDIAGAINTAIGAGNALAMELTWDTITFTFDALAGPITPPGSFFANRLSNVGLNFTVVEKTTP